MKSFSRSPCVRRSGMTLVEVLMAMIVIFVAVGGAMASITSFSVLSLSAREKTVALLEAQATIERMRSMNFNQVFRLFNSSAADDPGGVVAPGEGFAVAGLQARPGDADGLAGRVLFPVDPAAPTVLRETFADAAFGFPRDVNGDGDVDGANHAGDYIILPVRVRVEWRGQAGHDRAVELHTILRSQ